MGARNRRLGAAHAEWVETMIRSWIIRWLRLDERYERKTSIEEILDACRAAYHAADVGSGIQGGGDLSPDRKVRVSPKRRDTEDPDVEPA